MVLETAVRYKRDLVSVPSNPWQMSLAMSIVFGDTIEAIEGPPLYCLCTLIMYVQSTSYHYHKWLIPTIPIHITLAVSANRKKSFSLQLSSQQIVHELSVSM